ncbi:MAG: SpaA isopeptide-forming pilin-related protein, partial [Wujia sp.]
NTHTYENEATVVFGPGTPTSLGTDSKEQSLDYKVLKKNANPWAQGDGSAEITYSLDINPNGDNLNINKNYFVIEDTLDSDMILITDSIIIKDGDGNTYTRAASEEAVKNADNTSHKTYYVTYVDNLISFVVPDQNSLTVTYKVNMLYSSAYNTEKQFTNSVKVAEPFFAEQTEEVSRTSRKVATSSATINSEYFIIRKLDAYDIDRTLADAEFTVTEKEYDSVAGTWTDTGIIYRGTTNSNGVVYNGNFVDENDATHVLDIKINNIYEIRESQAPFGYTKSEKYYSIIFLDKDNPLPLSSIPSGTVTVSPGVLLLFTDIPKTEDNSLTITKNYIDRNGNVVAEYPASGAVFEIYQGNYTLEECKTSTHTKVQDANLNITYTETYDKDNKKHTIKLSAIPEGTYTVYEKSAAEGYELLSKVYHFTVDADKNITWDIDGTPGDAKPIQTATIANRLSVVNTFTINKLYYGANDDVTDDNAAISPVPSGMEKAQFTIKQTHIYNEVTGNYDTYAGTAEAITSDDGESFVVKNLAPGKYEIDEVASDVYKNNSKLPLTIEVNLIGVAQIYENGETTPVDYHWTDIFDKDYTVKNQVNDNSLTINKTYYAADGTQKEVPADGEKAIFTLYKVNGGSSTTAVAGTDFDTYVFTADTTAATTGYDEYKWTNLEPGTYKLVETVPASVADKYEPFTDITVTVDDNYQIMVGSQPKLYDAQANVRNKELNLSQQPCRFYLTKQLLAHNGTLTNVNTEALAAGITFDIKGYNEATGEYDKVVTKTEASGEVENKLEYNSANKRWEIWELKSGKYRITETNTKPGYETDPSSLPTIYLVIEDEIVEGVTRTKITSITYENIDDTDISTSSVFEAIAGGYTETLVANLINRPHDNSITVTKKYYEAGTTSTENKTNQPDSKARFSLYSGAVGSGTLVKTVTASTNDTYTFENLDPGSYYISETTIPTGYTGHSTADISFVVGNDYKITVTAPSTNSNYTVQVGEGAADYDARVTAENYADNSFTFTKVFYDNMGNVVPGYTVGGPSATFGLYNDNDSTTNIAATYMTDNSNGIYAVSNLPDGSYTIKEFTTASGYTLASDIKLVVENSKITVSYEGAGVDFTGVTNNGSFEVNAKLINRQTSNSITINKLYEDAYGNPIATNTLNSFASFKLYKAGVDITNRVTASFSQMSGRYTFSNIQPGTYVIKETAPIGFNAVGDVEITVNDDMTITVVGATGVTVDTDNALATSVTATNTQKSNKLEIMKYFLESDGSATTGTTTFTLKNSTVSRELIKPGEGGNTTAYYVLENIAPGSYEIVEATPEGYRQLNGRIYVTVAQDRSITTSFSPFSGVLPGDYDYSETNTNDAYSVRFALYNRKTDNSVKIIKTYTDANNRPLSIATDLVPAEYAVFKLYKVVSGSRIEVTDADKVIPNPANGEYQFVNLSEGSYVIVETAGANYTAAPEVAFTVDASGNIAGLTNATGTSNDKTITINNKRKLFDNKIIIDKRFINVASNDIANPLRALLCGDVKFGLYNTNNDKLADFVYDGTADTWSISKLEPGDYIIREYAHPEGFEEIADIDVTVTKSGTSTNIIMNYTGDNTNSVFDVSGSANNRTRS